MTKELEVTYEGDLPTGPEAAWAAITEQTSGWLWPIAYEPGRGGAARGLSSTEGTVTVWEPHARFATRAEKPGWFNQLEYELEPRAGGTHLRYRHTSVFEDVEYRACVAHTDFYYHSLGEYLGHFAGRQGAFASVEGPDASARPGSFAAACRALGAGDAQAGDRIEARLPGAGRIAATVDYRTAAFLGLRTDDALYRVFGRDAWGWPVGATLHLFGDDVDGAAAERAWGAWLGGVVAEEA